MKKRIRAGCLLLLLSALAGCGQGESTKAGSGVQTVVVGTGTDFPNIAFMDEKGELTGTVLPFKSRSVCIVLLSAFTVMYIGE
ncbi:hypothetical protein [Bacillus amyloliquefaciens]|uniref:hypothetical protein n=1 Tax=Bacillus amyloliquefaciens TaxID=1390 RepID=UPI0005EF484A